MKPTPATCTCHIAEGLLKSIRDGLLPEFGEVAVSLTSGRISGTTHWQLHSMVGTGTAPTLEIAVDRLRETHHDHPAMATHGKEQRS